jgi:hypothetical protein
MSQATFSSSMTCVFLVAVMLQVGCNRSFYRIQADEEAMAILREKTTDPRWSLPNYAFEPDSRSRMYSPFSQDHPPMPPDDPTAAQFMEVVDGKPGYPHWHANGDTPFVQNPEWQLFLPIEEDGVIRLRMEDAYRLALLHSREYQARNEELYLSALDVSKERFEFESQLFLPTRTSFSSSSISMGETLSLRKAGIAGSSFLVSLANDLVWTFPGSVSPSIGTLFSWSFSQPLLRGAGRDVVLEHLTQAERSFLDAIRSLERYRREFYLTITTDGGSYLSILQTQQQIRIQEANVATQRSVVAQFQALVEAGRINNQQLQFTQSSLYRAQETLLRRKNTNQNQIDAYKMRLGLPPDLDVVIEDQMLDQFQLIDVEMTDRQNRITRLQEETGNTILSLLDLRQDRAEELGIVVGAAEFNASGFRVEVPPVAAMTSSPRLVEGLQQVLSHIDAAEQIYREIVETSLPQARQDIERLDRKLNDRLESLSRLRASLAASNASDGEYAIEPEVLSDEQLRQTPEELKNYVALVERRLERFQATLEAARRDVLFLLSEGQELSEVARAKYVQDDVTSKVPTYLRELSGLYLELVLIQVEARTDSIVLDPVEVLAQQAFEVAKLYRRDWMNARAELIDSWRRIQIIANSLQSDLTLEARGGDSSRSTSASISFDAPITRLEERNRYRTELIRYSQARRAYYAFEDDINRNLRAIIRDLQRIKYNFEISRRGVKLAVMRVDQTDSELSRPPSPNASSRSLGSTAARDLLDALDDLRNTQLNFLDLWVEYERLRRQLDLDMGTMELDENGIWVDPGEFTPEYIDGLIEEAYQWAQPANAYHLDFPEIPVSEELLEGIETDLLPVIDDNELIPAREPVDEAGTMDLEGPSILQIPVPDPQGSLLPLKNPNDRLDLNSEVSSRKVHRASYVAAQDRGSETPRPSPDRPAAMETPQQLDVDTRAYFAGRLLEQWQKVETLPPSVEQVDPDVSSRRLPQ